MAEKFNIAIESTGDPVRDAEELAAAQRHRSRMDANICPNGCGQLDYEDLHTRRCKACGFIGWQNTPLITEGD